MAVQVEIDPGNRPAGERLAKRRRERTVDVVERRSGGEWRLPGVDRMPLAARVRDEQIGAAVTVEIRSRDTHPRIWVGHARAGCALLEAEAEAGRIGLPPARPGDVLVQPVRVTVVGDVEIGPPVAVEVGEDCTEAVIEPRRLEASLNADLAEARAAVPVTAHVHVEEVANAGVVVGKPGGGA